MANSYETYAQTKVETTCYNTKIYWQKQLVRPQAYLSKQQIHGTNKQFTFKKYINLLLRNIWNMKKSWNEIWKVWQQRRTVKCLSYHFNFNCERQTYYIYINLNIFLGISFERLIGLMA